jgi:hypothetical protein
MQTDLCSKCDAEEARRSKEARRAREARQAEEKSYAERGRLLVEEISQGGLLVVATTIYLESGETCHLETPAIYRKVLARSISSISGHLVATNRRLMFLSEMGGTQIPWKTVVHVSQKGDGVYLELTTKKGNGQYVVADPAMTEAVLTSMLMKFKRQPSASRYNSVSSRGAVSSSSVNHVSDKVRESLVTIIKQYGRTICDDPRRCKGLLQDLCGEQKREIHVLLEALNERVATEIMAASKAIPAELLITRLTQRLYENSGIAENHARWAVESWAIALELISNSKQR